MQLSDVKTVVDIISGVLTIVAVVAAAIWFLVSRSLAGNLQMTVDLSKVVDLADRRLAIVRVRVKNIGKTKVKKRACQMAIAEVSSPNPSPATIKIVSPFITYKDPYPILESTVELEPNEETFEDIGLAISGSPIIAVAVRFIRDPMINLHWFNTTWEASTLLTTAENSDPITPVEKPSITPASGQEAIRTNDGGSTGRTPP
jgi:hypothetical protein